MEKSFFYSLLSENKVGFFFSGHAACERNTVTFGLRHLQWNLNAFIPLWIQMQNIYIACGCGSICEMHHYAELEAKTIHY